MCNNELWEDEMPDYVKLLKSRGLTVTPQRIEIVNILASNKHINVDELYLLLHSSFPSISLATVYKNINVMLEKCLVAEVQIPNKKNVYELMEDEHSHVVCTQCEEIKDLHVDVSKLFKSAALKSGYSLSTSSIIFSGLCPKCSKE